MWLHRSKTVYLTHEPSTGLEYDPRCYRTPPDTRIWETTELESTSPYLEPVEPSDPAGLDIEKHKEALGTLSRTRFAIRNTEQAIQWALAQRYGWTHYCLVFVHSSFQTGAYYPSAAQAWRYAVHKHPVYSGAQVPRGVPVFWTGGSQGYGHVTLSLGGGLCRSTDWPTAGHISTVNIDYMTRAWGLRFEGWTEDLNRVRVWTPPPPSATDGVVSLNNLKPGKANVDVHEMQKRLVARNMGSFITWGYFGSKTRAAVTKWQLACGFRGADADGIPGMISMQRLGFKVNP